MKNRRTFMTKRLIKESLIDLLKNNKIDQITVTALCEEADINRSTFYTHYNNVADVISEIKDEFIHDYMPFVDKIEMRNHEIVKDVFISFFENIKKEREVLTVLIENTNIVNEVTQPMRINMKELYYHYWGNVQDENEIYLDACATYITFGFFASVNRWLEKGCPVDPNYLYDMLNTLTKQSFEKLRSLIYRIK